MNIKSVEFTAAFLDSVRGLGQDDTQRAIDSVSLEVAEGAIDPTTGLTFDDGVVGRIVVGLEDGTTAAFALKRNSD